MGDARVKLRNEEYPIFILQYAQRANTYVLTSIYHFEDFMLQTNVLSLATVELNIYCLKRS